MLDMEKLIGELDQALSRNVKQKRQLRDALNDLSDARDASQIALERLGEAIANMTRILGGSLK